MYSYVGGYQHPHIDIKITFTPGSDKSIEEKNKMLERLYKLKPIMERLPELVIFPAEEKLFETQNYGSWMFKGYQSSPPMIKSGLMKRGLTTRDPGLNQIVADDSSLLFTLVPDTYIEASRDSSKSRSPGVFYPGIHQEGGERHHQNIILELEEEDVEKIAELVDKYIVDGVIG